VKTGEYTEAALTRELCALGDGALDKSVFAPNAACDPYRSADGAVLPATWPDGRVDPDAAYLWTADFDASTTTCNLPVLRAANIVVHAEVDAEDCAAHGMCPKRLDPLLRNNGGHGLSLETPDLDHEALAAAFYARYKDDAEFARVDAFLCSYPAANCELFVPFDKPLVVYVTTRLEFGRFDSGLAWRKGLMKADAHERWEAWVHVVQNVAKDPRNTVAANSRYDVAYVKYHTGVDAAYVLLLLPLVLLRAPLLLLLLPLERLRAPLATAAAAQRCWSKKMPLPPTHSAPLLGTLSTRVRDSASSTPTPFWTNSSTWTRTGAERSSSKSSCPS